MKLQVASRVVPWPSRFRIFLQQTSMHSAVGEKFCRNKLKHTVLSDAHYRLSACPMHCVGCGRPYHYKRSKYCTACAAGHTIIDELGEDWPSESLRRVGEDIAVSAARHIRALRLYSGTDLHRPAASSSSRPEVQAPREPPVPPRVKSPLVRRRRTPVPGGLPHTTSSGQKPVEEPERRSPPAESKRGHEKRALASARAETREKAEVSEEYSYYTTSEDEDPEADKSLGRKAEEANPLGVAPKARAGRAETNKAESVDKGSEGPLKLESKAEVVVKQIKAEIEESKRLPREDIGTAEDKERSKQAYLQGLREQQAKRLVAEEKSRDKASEAQHHSGLKGGQLSLAGDYGNKEETSKRKRGRK